MKKILLVMVVALGGCAPAPGAAGAASSAEAVSLPKDETSCQRAGGLMKPVGRRQTLQCVLAYADAGKSCSSGSQCAGDCRAAPGIEISPGEPVPGYCQASSDRFGCSTKVENGRAQSTICID